MPLKTFTAALVPYRDVNTYLMQQMVITCTSGTRPASPVAGMHIWQTDTLTEHVYDGSAWQFLRGVDRFVRKTSDEIVNNSATLQNDDQLVIAVSANSRYRLELMLICSSSTTADIKGGWTGPSGATLTWGTFAPHRAQTTITSASTSVNLLAIGGVADMAGFGTSSNALYVLRGVLNVSSTAGNLQFQWAQSTADATNTTVRANSVLSVRRLP
jgi:hypothetical protein